MSVIGYLSEGSGANGENIASFRRGLADGGYIEGRNVAIEFHWAENQPGTASGACGRPSPASSGGDIHVGQVSVLFSVRFCAVHPKDAGDCRLLQFFEVPLN
jgi:hypothetical protein